MTKSSDSGLRKRLIDVLAQQKEGEWGFTGTRAGMTTFQQRMVQRVFHLGQPLILRVGGAYGADTEAYGAWREECKHKIAEIWPADERRAAIFRGHKHTIVQGVMPPLARNIEIVKRSPFLVATPHTETEEQRSGTWQTIREGLKADRTILIVWPYTKRLTLYQDKILYRVTYTGDVP